MGLNPFLTTKVKVICQSQGQISRTQFSKKQLLRGHSCFTNTSCLLLFVCYICSEDKYFTPLLTLSQTIPSFNCPGREAPLKNTCMEKGDNISNLFENTPLFISHFTLSPADTFNFEKS